jgi:hypothetical protein
MPKCRLCGHNRKLIKAHIIPEAFFREARGDDKKPRLIFDDPNIYPKKSLIGVYDQEILCDQCESKFQPLDDYGVQVLLNQFHELFLPVTYENRVVYQATNINYNLLLKFFVATLWRASVSTQMFYKDVNLEHLESLAKRAILTQDSSIPMHFSAILSRWVTDKDTALATKALLNPYPSTIYGINAYRFYFGQVVADIKADKRPLPDILRPVMLLQPTVILVDRELSRSKDFAAMVLTAEQSRKHEELRKSIKYSPKKND